MGGLYPQALHWLSEIGVPGPRQGRDPNLRVWASGGGRSPKNHNELICRFLVVKGVPILPPVEPRDRVNNFCLPPFDTDYQNAFWNFFVLRFHNATFRPTAGAIGKQKCVFERPLGVLPKYDLRFPQASSTVGTWRATKKP